MDKIVLILLFACSSAFAQDRKVSFYDDLNEYRQSKGLTTLEPSRKLERQAQRWLRKIKKYNGLVHDNSFHGMEVLVQNTYYPLEVWMQSIPHNKILTGKATRIGIAFLNGRACARLL